MNKECLLEGWSKKYKTPVMFYKYPCCGHLVESIRYSGNNIVECYRCNARLHKNVFDETVSQMKTAYKCKNCGTEITMTPENRMLSSFDGYMCYKCNNIIAVLFKGYVIHPQTILKPSWNKYDPKSLTMINENIGFICVTTDKDMFVLRTLNTIARHDNRCFMSILDEDTRKSGIIIDTVRNKYIGYVLWSDNKYEDGIKATIRQLFVIKDEQKKGYGTIVFKWWVENIADKIDNVFVVESPNKISIKILLNLGYAKESENGILGIKSLFTR